MSFEAKKYNQVFEEMRNRTTAVTDFEVGSVARTMYESFAYEMALLYEKMNQVYLSAYIDTAKGQQLDQVVAILGIRRGLPDFAEGKVTFDRDVGNEDIAIPLGTLVATEDTPEVPKKVYQTTEEAVLRKANIQIEVKVQAIERGEEMTTLAETIGVMPRPVPGIKSVVNRDGILFLGKRRESDDELRQRAKNALISSGKATTLSIENALLGLPGVKDAKVKEDFFAKGELTFELIDASLILEDLEIPKGTKIEVEVEGETKLFETAKATVFPAFSEGVVELGDGEAVMYGMEINVPVQSTQEGKFGEIENTSDLTWKFINESFDSLINLRATEPLLLEEFGIIRVFVDGPDLNDSEERSRIKKEIDKVRAAGVFVLLEAVNKIRVDGVFRVELSEALNLSAEERTLYENGIRDLIIQMLAGLKMGDPFLFSKMIKQVLSFDGVENLDDFQLNTVKELPDEAPIAAAYAFSDKRILLEEFERLDPQYICVASEEKELRINMTFKADGLTEFTHQEVLSALNDYLKGQAYGTEISKNALASTINTVPGLTLIGDTLQVTPHSWCPRELIRIDESTEDEIIQTSFVEKPVVGNVFPYQNYLNISGALKLLLPNNLPGEEKVRIREEITAILTEYLDNLAAEEDVVFEEIINRAVAVNQVLNVDLDETDFVIELPGGDPTGRITEDKIEIELFEKARFDKLCISGDIEPVAISTTGLSIEITTPGVESADITTLENMIVNAFNGALSGTNQGDDVNYNNLKTSIENLNPAIVYTVTELSLTATSDCDGRIQTADLVNPVNFHIRSVELATMTSITTDNITTVTP